MAETVEQVGLGSLLIHTSPAVEMSDDQFFRFCQINGDLRIERTSDGDLIIMPPAGGSSSRGNAELTYLFQQWARRDGTGEVFDSSAGFKLPNGAIRSPDVSWVRKERLDGLSEEEWAKFLPLCPDFVLELRPPSDSVASVHRKMEEYIDNGARLGWLLDPVRRQAHIYQPRQRVQVLDDSAHLLGEPLLHSFSLDLDQIWAVTVRKKHPRAS